MKSLFQAFLFCVIIAFGLFAANADSKVVVFFYVVAMAVTGIFLALNMSGAGNSDGTN